MTTGPRNTVLSQLCGAALLRAEASGPTDAQLLAAFLERRDEAAFAALVRRHGPMVWGVCRRALNEHDAEDAFQATFLVLVRKASAVVPRELVANWLYGVAHTTALRARALAARRAVRERQVAEMPEPQAAPPDRWPDLRPLLDRELSRLPEKYRAPVVLCDLEGKTHKEAARQLGWPQGTVAGRLARARALLARRLTRRGLALAGGALAALLSRHAASAAVPAPVVSATIQAGTALATAGAIPAGVTALTEGVLQTMTLTKVKTVTAALLVTACLGAGGLLYRTEAGGNTAPAAQKDERPADDLLAQQRDRALIEKQREQAIVIENAVAEAKRRIATLLEEVVEHTGDPQAALQALGKIERAVKELKQAKPRAKVPVWTLDVRFKNPRLVMVDVPGQGKQAVWYCWYEVLNNTDKAHTFLPDLELVTDGKVYHDTILPGVEEAVRRLEDPERARELKNSVTFAEAPIPPSNKDSPRRGVAGLAFWTDVDPNAKEFTLFVSGLTNAWSADGGTVRRKVLKLGFRRLGNDVRATEVSEWVYRPADPGRKEGGKDPQAELRRLIQQVRDRVAVLEQNIRDGERLSPDERTARDLELRSHLRRLKDLERQLPAASPEGQGRGSMEGVVEKVQDNLLQLSVGSDNGVQMGERFEIYRLKPNPLYVGTAEIVDVTAHRSVARLVRGTGVREGDRAARGVKWSP
jgi:RNA polymerase sigma factor (sigma-70 family)